MTQTTHSHTSTQIATDAAFDDSFQGLQTSNFTTKIASLEDNLYFDGKSIFSDGALAIGTSANKHVVLGADSTAYLKIETDGEINFLSGKMSINGNTGTSGQVLSTDGNGNMSWLTVDYTQYAFSNIAVSGQTTIQANATSDTLTFAAGSGIQLTTDGSGTVTIANTGTAANAFSTFAVESGSGSSSGASIVADTDGDTFTFVAGSGITLTNNPSTDKITIAATQTGEANQNALSSIAVSGQSTISSASATDTLTLGSSTDRNKITITTDTSTNTATLKTNIPRTLSMSGRIPTTDSAGELSGVPLVNHFVNRQVSGVVASGGGDSIGVSTRALSATKANGTADRIVMPAKSDSSTLLLQMTKADGTTTQNFEIDMNESAA
tara:strand:- start:634 stop:1776 length:1143 start_codon:yes stop_codon:yes gene_type:complete